MSQTKKFENLASVSNQKEFDCRRALAQYIAVIFRPDLCVLIHIIAAGNQASPNEDDKSLAKATKQLKDTPEHGLIFTALEFSTIQITLATDAYLATVRGLLSQRGYMIMLTDSQGRSNFINYGSSRCKRVTWSVMAAKVHALILGLDQTYAIRDLLHELAGRELEITAYADRKTPSEVVAKEATTM